MSYDEEIEESQLLCLQGRVRACDQRLDTWKIKESDRLTRAEKEQLFRDINPHAIKDAYINLDWYHTDIHDYF